MLRPPPTLCLLLGALGALGALTACTGEDAAAPPSAAEAHAATAAAIPYRLDRPDAAFALPRALVEISGLTALGPDRLAAVQDEDGLLFVLDRETGDVLDEVPFARGGDYEGVERVGDAVWVLESRGTLYEVTGLGAGAPTTTRYTVPLPRRCDAEGLGYEPGTAGEGAADGRLLIACKEDPGPELPGMRAIYAFDLREKRLSDRAVFLLDRGHLDDDGRSFMPSALAVHPRTGQIYVLSAARRALAVLSPEGDLTAALALPAHLYGQPEALTFFPDGTLFIANEGGATATLLRFSEVTP